MIKIPKARQLASGDWFIQIRLTDETGIRRSIPVHGATEAQCQAEAMAIKSGLKPTPAKRGTLRAAMNDYIKQKRKTLSPSTIRGYVGYRDNHLQPWMDLDMTTVDWQKAVDSMTCSAKTVRNVWNFAHAAMADKGFFPHVRLPRATKTDMQWLTPEQIPAFLEGVRGRPCELPALLGLHSLRRSEMFALTTGDINLKDKIIRVRGSLVLDEKNRPVMREENKTKNSTRDIPIMIPRLLELLEAKQGQKGPLLTCHVGKPYEGINAACRRQGLPEVGVHGLRRTFASLGYSLGMSEEEIMSIGGWDDFGTMHRFYVYLSDLDRKKAVNKMSRFYSPEG